MKQFNNEKGVALIIVIFAMMLFAILGWTLANLQSGDFEINLRNLDSERALGLAEAGTQWALGQLSASSCFRTGGDCNSVDSDCNDTGDWLTTPHSLNPGQYNICCRNPTISEITNAVIEARGYIPGQANYRARREVKLLVTLGSFSKVLQAKNLFDWSAMHSDSRINGDIQALYYERDGDGTYNEVGVDYDPPPTPVLPPDGTGDDRTIASQPYPTINMAYFENEAKNISYSPPGDNIWVPALTAKILVVDSTVDGGTRTQLDLNTAIFSGSSNWNAQALRNITMGAWQSGSWKEIYSIIDSDTVKLEGVVTWKEGERITLVPRIFSISTDIPNRTYTMTFDCALAWSVNEAVRNFSRGSWNFVDWGIIRSISTGASSTSLTIRVDDSVDLNNSANLWLVNDWLGEVKRYRDNVNNQDLWYIMADVIFDLRDQQSWESGGINGNIAFSRTSLVAEGDITIKGPNQISFSERPLIYPNLATKNGNLSSPDEPDGGSDSAKRQSREFRNIVYTENGSLFFNYLDGKAAYGNNVTFDGQVSLDYDNDLTSQPGFAWGLSNRIWKEQ